MVESGLDRVANSPLLKFVLSTTLWTGGVAFLLSERAQKRRLERIESFLEGVDARVTELEADNRVIDQGEADSDEFLTTFEWAIDEVTKTDDEVKLRFVREFLVASALSVRPDTSLRRIFGSYVSRLAGAHMLLLVELASIQTALP